MYDAGIRKRIDEALEGKGESDTDGGEASEPKKKKDKKTKDSSSSQSGGGSDSVQSGSEDSE